MPRLISLALALVMLGAAGNATAGGWATPAEPAAMQDFVIHGFPPGIAPEVTALGTLGDVVALQPGEAVLLTLGVYDYEICGVSIRCFIPADVAATWSVSPDDGATINLVTGLLTIDTDVPSGSEFAVTAEVDDGRHVVTIEVYVYTPEGNPFVGFWREAAQLACDDGAEIVPESGIEEMIFAADGSFAVTWQPFESYVDYWGTYTFDLDAGTVELTVADGNHVPDDVDGMGRFAVDGAGNLVLSDLWLGTSHSSDDPPACGHRFARPGRDA